MTTSAPAGRDSTLTLTRHSEAGLSYLEGGRGNPIVLLHGIPGSALAWAAVGERLAQHYRVVIPDLLGFGRSDSANGDFYMEAQARRIGRFLDRLGIAELVLAGHDFGGPVAVTLSRLCPELRIRALILSATNLFTDTYVPPPLRLAGSPMLGASLFRLIAGNRWGLRLMYEAAAVQKREIPWQRFRRHLTASGMDLTWRIFHRSLADLGTNYRDIEALLPKLAVPTLVLWGDRDPFFAVSVGERSHHAIPGSVFRTFAETGHFVPEEQPRLVADGILEFLAQVKS